MKNPLPLLFWLLILGGVLSYVITSSQKTVENREELKAAYTHYIKGETADTLGVKEDSFNQALKYYTDLEAGHDPSSGNGKLYYNIGNSYFHLGAYPFAVLYYYKAQNLMPREDKVGNNLQVALAKLGLQEVKEESWGSIPLSIPEKLQLFFGLTLAAFFLASLCIWTQWMWLKKGANILMLLGGVLILNLGYLHYLAPIEGVLVKSTPLYRDAGLQYAKVKEEPLLSGAKVEVLDVVKEGQWLKIETPAGQVGYVLHESIRVI